MELSSLLQVAGTFVELFGTVLAALDLALPRTAPRVTMESDPIESALAELSDAIVSNDQPGLSRLRSHLHDLAMQAAGNAAREHHVGSILQRRGKAGLVFVVLGMLMQGSGGVLGMIHPVPSDGLREHRNDGMDAGLRP